MQYFMTLAGVRYAYDDDVEVTITEGVSIVKTAAGATIPAPTDLQPTTAPTPPTAAQIAAQQAATAWSAYQAQAQAALNKSDITIWRCTENAVAVPAAWAAYRAALRSIISAATGDPTKPLPVRPAYPAGT